MTPANPDALADALVDQIARILDLDAHHLGRPDYYGPEQIRAFASARVRVSRQTAGAIIAGPLAPILAAKEAAEARAAQLQAEVEAKDKRIAVLTEALKPFADDARTYGDHPGDANCLLYDGIRRDLRVRHLRAARTAVAARAATAREE